MCRSSQFFPDFGKRWGGSGVAMWVVGGRCHLISDIFCSGGDGTTSVRGLPTSRSL